MPQPEQRPLLDQSTECASHAGAHACLTPDRTLRHACLFGKRAFAFATKCLCIATSCAAPLPEAISALYITHAKRASLRPLAVPHLQVPASKLFTHVAQ